MAKLERKNIKIFASQPNDATQVTSFLTAKDETPNVSSDPNVIQNANYVKGWLAEGNDNLPQVEDMNGVMYSESYKNAYLYQMGIAEWNILDEYNENSFCQVEGVLYKSLVDNNIGNNPTTDDGTKWEEIPLEPYTGENIGTAEGIYAGKTSNNELQFKGIAVTGNGNISASEDTITIAIGGGGTGDVYWGAIDGTLSNQSDLQQALNQKQNLIGYTPENVANKVTTVRGDTVATDTAYPSELATRTAIDNAITSANNYTDNALTNLSTDAFVLYANSWTDVYTGTLITTAPTGNGTEYHFTDIWDDDVEEIANFSFTTTSETRLNDTFTYDVLIPIRNANINNWYFVATLTISHPDVNSGNETTIFDYGDPHVITINGESDYQFKQDLINISDLVYPVGSTVNLKVMVGALPQSGDTSPYNLDLLLYDSTSPLVVSRNRGINRFYVTAFNTLASGTYTNQESFNVKVYEQIQNKQDSINALTITETSTTFDVIPKSSITTSNIGSSTYPFSNSYIDDIKTDQISGITTSTVVNTAADILPTVTNTYDLGSSSKAFAEGYINEVNSTTVKVGTLSPKTGNTDINISSTLLPTTNSIDLGSNNNKFQTAHIGITYTNSLNKIGTGGINIYADLVPTTGQYLGSSTQAFGKTYTDEINVATIVGTAASPNTGSILAKGRLYIYDGTREVIQFGFSQAIPSTAGAYNLGSSDNYFNGVTASQFIQRPSDIREKENIENYKNSVLDKLDKLNPISYTIKGSDDKSIKLGLSAQELQEIEPLCVVGSETKSDEKLGIDLYSTLTLAMQAIKELNEKVKSLEARVEELEGNKKELEK